MVDLAKQAFSAKNFDLAAEIYERTIAEHGPKSNLLLGLADSLAKAGCFEKAFTVYSKASRVGPLSPSDLRHLVTALVNTVKQETQLDTEMNKNAIFDCGMCRNFLSEPVTIQCGHTFCRSCLTKDRSKRCKTCGTFYQNMNISRIKTNVLLSQTMEKWFPNHCNAVRLKKRANSAFQGCYFEDAIVLYSQAIEMAPNDHILFSNRSHAFTSLDRFSEALTDAEAVLKLRPDWPKVAYSDRDGKKYGLKGEELVCSLGYDINEIPDIQGYFRRGCALYGLGRYEESVVSLLQCLALDSSIETAKDYLTKALHSILTPLSPDDPKSVELQRQLNPSLLNKLIHSNFDSSLLLPTVTVETVRQLKDIISDTITSASNFLEGNGANRSSEASGVEPSSSSIDSSQCLSASSSHEQYSSGPNNQTSYTNSSNQAQEKTDTTGKTNNYPEVDPNLITRDDFECSLCYRLLYQPVTPPCGHMFCRNCLDRCLDHKSECPLCKTCLAEYLAERRQELTSSVDKLLQYYLPAEYEQRKKQHEEELADLASMGLDNEHEIPVFVCTVAFPNVSCPLHIFEPRYRLMIRQCMESGRRQFGMCVATGTEPNEFSEYGCMLEIRNVQFFPDGRSIVDCIGGKRFRVIGRSQRDGYNTAKVEFLADHPIEENLDEIRRLSESVYNTCNSWFQALSFQQKDQIKQHLGEMPQPETDTNYGANGSAWHWWMIAVLPIDPRIQMAMMAMLTYKERLQGLRRVVGYICNRRDSH